MKLLRIGSNGNEKPAALDKNGKIRDISSIMSDLDPRTLNFKNISEISVASGVVVDSNANHEFNENFLKAKALIDLFK